MNKTTRTNVVDGVSGYIDLGLKAGKGRSIGYFISRSECDYVPQVDGSNYHEPGHEFEGRVQPARDCQAFGACVPCVVASTAEERDRLISCKLAAGRKRYGKLFGG